MTRHCFDLPSLVVVYLGHTFLIPGLKDLQLLPCTLELILLLLKPVLIIRALFPEILNILSFHIDLSPEFSNLLFILALQLL